MGLDTSHDCWHGAYSAFHRFRLAVAKAAGIPLLLMGGYYEAPPADSLDWARARDGGPLCRSHLGPPIARWCSDVASALPLSWDLFSDDPIAILLTHSDCDGEIAAEDCGPLADRMELLLPALDEGCGDSARRFIAGLRAAAAAGENVEFH